MKNKMGNNSEPDNSEEYQKRRKIQEIDTSLQVIEQYCSENKNGIGSQKEKSTDVYEEKYANDAYLKQNLTQTMSIDNHHVHADKSVLERTSVFKDNSHGEKESPGSGLFSREGPKDTAPLIHSEQVGGNCMYLKDHDVSAPEYEIDQLQDGYNSQQKNFNNSLPGSNIYESKVVEPNSSFHDFIKQNDEQVSAVNQNNISNEVSKNIFFSSKQDVDEMNMTLNHGESNNDKRDTTESLFATVKSSLTELPKIENSSDATVQKISNGVYGGIHNTSENFSNYEINSIKNSTPSLWTPQENYKYFSKSDDCSIKSEQSLSKCYSMPFQNFYKEIDMSSENKHYMQNCDKNHKYVNDLRHYYLNQHGPLEFSNQFSTQVPNTYVNQIENEQIIQNSSNNTQNNENIVDKHIYHNIQTNFLSEHFYKNSHSEEMSLIESLENEPKFFQESPRLQEKSNFSGFSNYSNSSPHQQPMSKKNLNLNPSLEEIHDDHGTSFKVLSPIGKQENQDDGYETSAGDVLTPNSYSSSNATTPQQNINHIANLKTEENANQQNQLRSVHPSALSNSFDLNGSKTALDDAFSYKNDQLNTHSPQRSSENTQHNIAHIVGNSESYINSPKLDVDCLLEKPPPKRRGRKKKIVDPLEARLNESACLVSMKNNSAQQKERKKHDRFNGLTEEEVIKRIVPDHLAENLDIVIIGINPGLFAAYKGHHYAGPGNHFWKCLFLSGLIPEQMSAEEDYKLIDLGIGLTNLVSRPTKGSADLTRKEIKEGSETLLEKIKRYKPKIAVFNGKFIFEVFSGTKDFHFGKQPECINGTNTFVWVMPSSSARCAQLPRAADKIPFYSALKKYRDFLNGIETNLEEDECVFTEEKIKELCTLEKRDSVENIRLNLDDIGNYEGLENKKKRGRPKKIKDGTLEVEKKKRGRPKKIRESIATHSVECNLKRSSLQEQNLRHEPNGNLTPCNCQSPSIQNNVFQMISPISSPLVNCSYTLATPPLNSKPSTPIYQHVNQEVLKDSIKKKFCEGEKNLPILQQLTHISSTNDSHLGDTPPPSSPNICTDFEPPGNNVNNSSENERSNTNVLPEREARFSESLNTVSADEKSPQAFPNWMSAQSNVANSSVSFSDEHSTMNYLGISQPSSFGDGRDWQMRQIYNEGNFRFGASVGSNKNEQKPHSSDVARKSLCGLESLVDQIPTTPDKQSSCSSNCTTMNPNISSSLMCSASDRSLPEIHQSDHGSLRRSDNENVNTNRFSVSNLVESNHSNPIPTYIATTAERSNPYHHSDIMAAAALAAVAANQSNPSHHVQHSSLYMDPHITHVSTNPIYGHGHHTNHQHVSHHHPSAYSSSHVDYGSPYSLPTQVNALHMPGPNYPYTFSAASAQNNFTNYMHHTHHPHSHTSTHLSMYERLKGSNIGAYGGF